MFSKTAHCEIVVEIEKDIINYFEAFKGVIYE